MIAYLLVRWRRCLSAFAVWLPRRPPADPKDAERWRKVEHKAHVMDAAVALTYELRHQDARFVKEVLREMHGLLCLDKEPRQERVTK